MEKENKKLLKFANEQLKERGYKLSVKAEDNTYRLDICNLKGKVIDNYADGYFEEELPNLLNDALLCCLMKEHYLVSASISWIAMLTSLTRKSLMKYPTRRY